MKKINFFIIFTLLICQNIHSLELWNGFTDKMTKNQVISRAIKLFNAKTKENSLFGNTFSSGMELFFNEKQRTEHYFSFADKEIYLNEFCQTTGYEPFAKLSIFSKAKLEKGKVLLKQQEEDVQNKKIKELKQAVDSIKF